jgi:hypothetical protein
MLKGKFGETSCRGTEGETSAVCHMREGGSFQSARTAGQAASSFDGSRRRQPRRGGDAARRRNLEMALHGTWEGKAREAPIGEDGRVCTSDG